MHSCNHRLPSSSQEGSGHDHTLKSRALYRNLNTYQLTFRPTWKAAFISGTAHAGWSIHAEVHYEAPWT